jgi:hypothetical protein
MRSKKSTLINALIVAVICSAVIFAGVFGCAGGCFTSSGNYEFFFNDSRLGMFIGDEKTFTAEDFMFEPSAPSKFKFTLRSADESVISVSGSTVYAKKEGVTTLTAEDGGGKTAECTVEVTGEITSFELMPAATSRAVSENREIDVYAVINGGAVSSDGFAVTWTENGVRSLYSGGVYTLPPSDEPRNVELSASVISKEGKTFSSSVSVNWYMPFVSAPVIKRSYGVTEQNAASVSEVGYSLEYDLGAGNSVPVIEWFVNGERVASDRDEFSFVPSGPGGYKVSARVNGVQAACADGGTVKVEGAVVPSGLKVDFDTFYPYVSLSWTASCADERFTISVTRDSDGSVKEYTATGGSIMLSSDEVDLFASSYSFKVKSLGDGDALTESEYCLPVTAGKLKTEVAQYLNKTWFGGNYYITSDEEFFAIYDYFMLYRDQPSVKNTSAKYTVYMAYESKYTTDRLSEIAFNRAGYTGSYEIDASRDGRLLHLSFKFYTVSTPSKHNAVSSSRAKALDGILPHVSAVGRAEDYVPAIEKKERFAAVYTTDQLYRAAELGYRPVTAASSPAYAYYDYAKKLLNSILDEGMSDVEKVHAIYDWIMWRVLYDDGTAGITVISEAVLYESFYIEGVLTDTDYLAVCDGMSKTFSLLCNIEGIPCVRVIGSAGSGGSYGGHAWNKVCIDGQWYIADCTWGDMQVSVKYKKGTLWDPTETVEAMELASHMYFLVTDAMVSATHTEDKDTAYPRTAAVPYNWYAEAEYSTGGSTFRSYVFEDADLSEYAVLLASYAADRLNDGRQDMEVFGGVISSPYFAFEIKIAENAVAAVKPILTKADKSKNPLAAALGREGLYYNIYSVDNYVVVIASKNVRLS